MKISEDQILVVKILTDVLIKIALAASSIGGFWYILIHLMQAKDSSLQWTLGFLDLMLSGTLYYIIAHYFPAFKAVAKPKSAPKKS